MALALTLAAPGRRRRPEVRGGSGPPGRRAPRRAARRGATSSTSATPTLTGRKTIRAACTSRTAPLSEISRIAGRENARAVGAAIRALAIPSDRCSRARCAAPWRRRCSPSASRRNRWRFERAARSRRAARDATRPSRASLHPGAARHQPGPGRPRVSLLQPGRRAIPRRGRGRRRTAPAAPTSRWSRASASSSGAISPPRRRADEPLDPRERDLPHRARGQARRPPRRGGAHPRRGGGRRRGRRSACARCRRRRYARSDGVRPPRPQGPRGARRRGGRPVTQLEVLEALTRIDASAGWCLMVARRRWACPRASSPTRRSARSSPAAASRPPPSPSSPAGTATPVDGGYRLSGRWPFASGVRHAEWLTAGAMVRRDARELGERHIVVIPAARRGDPRQLEGGRARGHRQQRFLRHRPLRARRLRVEPRHRDAPARRRALPAGHARLRGLRACGLRPRAWRAGRSTRAWSWPRASEGASSRRPPLAGRAAFQALLGESEIRLRMVRAGALELFEAAWATAVRRRDAGAAPAGRAAERRRLRHRHGSRHRHACLPRLRRRRALPYRHPPARPPPHPRGRQHFMVNDSAYERLGRSCWASPMSIRWGDRLRSLPDTLPGDDATQVLPGAARPHHAGSPSCLLRLHGLPARRHLPGRRGARAPPGHALGRRGPGRLLRCDDPEPARPGDVRASRCSGGSATSTPGARESRPPTRNGSSVSLFDLSGQRLLYTPEPFGATLPPRPGAMAERFRDARRVAAAGSVRRLHATDAEPPGLLRGGAGGA